MSRPPSRREQQHALGSQHLHEVDEWKPPPSRRSRKPPPHVPGQLAIDVPSAGGEG